MTAARIDHYPQQQFSQGYAIEELETDQSLHLVTTGQVLGNVKTPANDHFSIPNHSYRTISRAEVDEMFEQDRQAIIETAIKGRTIDLGSTALESIFVFNPDKQTEAPELA